MATDRAEVVRLRAALIGIARWEGPGNNEVRVRACQALDADPRARHEWDFGPTPGFAPPRLEPVPAAEALTELHEHAAAGQAISDYVGLS